MLVSLYVHECIELRRRSYREEIIMTKKTKLLTMLVSVAFVMTACSSVQEATTEALTEAEEVAVELTTEAIASEAEAKAEIATKETPTKDVVEKEVVTKESADAITEQQALDAIKQYNYLRDPKLKDMESSDEYTIFWDVSTNENNEIVVLYRSYTAAEVRYYINPSSGDTYVTQFVKGVTDQEEKTEETFNIKEYMN